MAASFEEAWRRADKIYGWLHEEEARALYDHCESPWCEIGSFLGRSTVVLAAKGFGYCVDTWQGTPAHNLEMAYVDEHDAYKEHLQNVGIRVQRFAGDFRLAAPLVPDFKFLYLDADHDYAETRDAFQLYAAKLRPGGLVAFHDYEDPGWPGVREFVDTLDWPWVAREDRLVILRRPEED